MHAAHWKSYKSWPEQSNRITQCNLIKLIHHTMSERPSWPPYFPKFAFIFCFTTKYITISNIIWDGNIFESTGKLCFLLGGVLRVRNWWRAFWIVRLRKAWKWILSFTVQLVLILNSVLWLWYRFHVTTPSGNHFSNCDSCTIFEEVKNRYKFWGVYKNLF